MTFNARESGRHVAEMLVEGAFFLTFAQGGAFQVVKDAVPPDAQIVEGHWDGRHFRLLLEHPSFPESVKGKPLPVLPGPGLKRLTFPRGVEWESEPIPITCPPSSSEPVRIRLRVPDEGTDFGDRLEATVQARLEAERIALAREAVGYRCVKCRAELPLGDCWIEAGQGILCPACAPAVGGAGSAGYNPER